MFPGTTLPLPASPASELPLKSARDQIDIRDERRPLRDRRRLAMSVVLAVALRS
jgi:hypothetical protein